MIHHMLQGLSPDELYDAIEPGKKTFDELIDIIHTESGLSDQYIDKMEIWHEL